jgi:putative endonuclease
MAKKDDLGRAGEERAAAYLRSRGYHVLARNWRGRGGELDIVAVRGTELVAVEVKTRSGTGFGHPFEAVDERKLARIWRLALQWRGAHPDIGRGRVIRVDAIALIGPDPATASLEHLQDLR